LKLHSMLIAALAAFCPFHADAQQNTTATPQTNGDPCLPAGSGRTPGGPLDVARRVRIYEDTGNRWIVQYNPEEPNNTIMYVDADSSIVIDLQPDPCSEIFLNEVFMSARLSHSSGGDAEGTNMEITNYAELPKDAATRAGRAAGTIRTSGGLFGLINQMVRTVEYLKNNLTASTDVPAAANVLKANKARIDSITTALTDTNNSYALSQIAGRAFQIDLPSMMATATAFANTVTDFLDAAARGATDETHAKQDLEMIREYIGRIDQALHDAARDLHLSQFDAETIRRLWAQSAAGETLVPGTIALPKYKAADGDMITINVAVRTPGGENAAGASKDFHLRVRRYHTRVEAASSLLFLRRLRDIKDENGVLQRVNFAPAAGVTLAAVFYNRTLAATGCPAIVRRSDSSTKTHGNAGSAQATASGAAAPGVEHGLPNVNCYVRKFGKLNALKSGLAPGVGVNVSFMNWQTPADFDVTANEGKGAFRTTDSSAVQVGAGFVVSLFSNAVQGTFGWNLQTPAPRAYWGLGFNFIEAGKEIAKYVKKSD
jgi:hypothetical protein